MNLLALALGLFFERFMTHFFHLREARWLDGYFDAALRVVDGKRSVFALLIAIATVLVPILPVAAFAWGFRHLLFGVPYLLFAVIVLIFSLGPRDLEDEVDEYIEAVRNDDQGRADRVAKELLETEPPRPGGERTLAIEEAIFIQANNRLFGVVLWFMLLGPVGAWAFRVSDMFRRRAIFEAGRAESFSERRNYSFAAQRVHGAMAWLPARLVAMAYALAGSFETAVSDWREYYQDCADHFFDVNDDVVACAGVGALGAAALPQAATPVAPEIQGARNAMRLVSRTLWVWLTAIAVLTIFGFAV